ncbi:hypothetical protein PGQ11_007776 [Apiospora arundinis]|uniref:Uncharacterized protein n=1 Tax=Apiospora arundinis TaxID=335852 RepID=A0ABR2IXQ7_9PEZI
MTPNQYSAPQKHCFLSLEQTSRGLDQDFRPCRAQTGRNRITQRNYRKKLKRGLEGFEKGSDTNSTPVGAKNQAEAPRKENKTLSMKSDSNVASFNAPQPESQCIPAMYIDHERLFPPLRYTLQRSRTPPHTAYPNLHPLLDDMKLSPLLPHGTDTLRPPQHGRGLHGHNGAVHTSIYYALHRRYQ